MAVLSCRASIRIPSIDAQPEAQYRKVDVKCCLIKQTASTFFYVPETKAIKLYSAKNRYYFLDGESWKNLIKNVLERDGIIKAYEAYPCVNKKN